MRFRGSSASTTKPERLATLAVLGGLIAAAWAALAAWGASPYAGYLDHERLEALDAGAAPAVALLTGGWTLMIVAMMLPASLPLVHLFRRMVARRIDGGRLVALLVAGYLLVWTLFGAALHAGDLALHEAVLGLAWLEANEWAIGTSVLLTAGAFQFSSLKYRCVSKCRSPRFFLMERWGRRSPSRDALALGMGHGLFCVGCCWGLMLVMFAVGIGNLAWMLALGAVMAIERNARWGRRLSAPLGWTLIGCAGLVVATA